MTHVPLSLAMLTTDLYKFTDLIILSVMKHAPEIMIGQSAEKQKR